MAPILSALSFGSRGYGFIGGLSGVYNVSASSTSISEGSSVTFTITTNQNTGVTLYWTLSGVNHSDISGGVLAGSFTTSGSNGNTSNTVVVTTLVDADTDTDSLVFELRTVDFFGSVVAVSPTVTINNTPSVGGGTFSYNYSSGTSNGTSTAAPANIYFRRNIFQTIYTAAELSSNGASSGAIFDKLRWFITGAVPAANSVRGLNIRLFHTTASDGSTLATPISGESKTTVYSVSDTTQVTEFEAIGNAIFNFTSTFTWNGTNNICIESCTAQNETNYTSAGTQRIFNVTNGSRYSWSDNAGTSCSETPTTVQAFKPSVEMDYTGGGGASPAPTATITPTSSSINENQSVTFNVTTTNFTSGTLYWSLLGLVNGNDFTGGVTTGSFSVSGSAGNVTLTTTDDLFTEGVERFRLQVRTGSTSGTIIGSSSTVTISDTSTTPTVSVTPSTTNLNEGSSVTFTISTSLSSGTLYWTTNAVSGTINASDFTGGATSGSVAISGGSGSVVLTLANDTTTEGTESFQLQIRSVSVSGNILATSSTVTINDTSIGVPGAAYFGGGDGTFPSYYSTMDKLTYSSDTTSLLPGSPLSVARTALAATGNTTSGYFGGGQTGAAPATSYVDRMTYSTDTRTQLTTTGFNTIQAHAATGSATAGYFSGGYLGPASRIDKLTYSTETRSTIPATLTSGRYRLAATGNTTVGYFGSGAPGPTSAMDKLTYSTELISALPSTSFTPASTSYAATGNSTQGYWDQGSNFNTNFYKLTYSTELLSTLSSSNLSSASSKAATGNSNSGYFGGNSNISSVVSKLDYSTDLITNTPSAMSLSLPRRTAAAASPSANGL
jgi:hypothetical protein